MPYNWSQTEPHHLTLWPYRSLPRRGFVGFIAVTAGLIAIPLIEFVGSAAFWVLLPFCAAAVGGVWLALSYSYRSGTVLEELRIRPDRIELSRHNPNGPRQDWAANPHWVTVQLYPTGGPVPDYVTLKGGGREVEIGAFLTEAERQALERDLRARLALVR